MKNQSKWMFGLILAAPIAILALGCRDRAAEKRIAELEARLSQVEASKNSTAAATPTTATATPTTPEEKPAGPIAVAEFERLEHDFGTIREGEKVSYTYKFTNAGEAPLIIQSVQPSCGCTAPEWEKNPVAVGKAGFVKVEFDSNGKTGIQNKTITVNSNTWPKQTVLRFKAMVTPKADGANGPVK